MPDLQAPRTAPSYDVRAVAPDEWVAEVTGLYADESLSFDWLSACDEIGVADEFRVVIRFDRADGSGVRLEARVSRTEPLLPSLRDVIPGVAWHERETSEFFGIAFASSDGIPVPANPLLLPGENAPGNPGGWPLRKDYVLGSRAVTSWPADAGGAEDARRRQAPAGVPDPTLWGARPADAGPPDPAEIAAPSGRRRR